MKFKNAFECKRYDGVTPCSCPAWLEIVQENPATGETRLLKDCQYQLAPIIWVELIKAANRPAAAIESTRNEIAQGFSKVAQVMGQTLPLLAHEEGEDA